MNKFTNHAVFKMKMYNSGLFFLEIKKEDKKKDEERQKAKS
jgi:hypothetical protein